MLSASGQQPDSFDVINVIDGSRLNFHSFMIVTLCGLCLIVDGFNV